MGAQNLVMLHHIPERLRVDVLKTQGFLIAQLCKLARPRSPGQPPVVLVKEAEHQIDRQSHVYVGIVVSCILYLGDVVQILTFGFDIEFGDRLEESTTCEEAFIGR